MGGEDREGAEMIRRCKEHGYYRGRSCDCGEEGEFILDADRTVRLGKILSGALRHFPEDLGVEVDEGGWADVDNLLEAIKKRYPWVEPVHIEALISSDLKGRYEYDGICIRARYGHSIDVELDYPESTLFRLYYGASEEEADRILEIGLRPIDQSYVHLSTSRDNAVFAASFRIDHPIILEVLADEARAKGIRILHVNEKIALARAIPPEFLQKL